MNDQAIAFGIGVFVGASVLTLLVGGGIWEAGVKAGEITAWRKVPEAMRICKGMLDQGDLNDIQETYCAELLAQALGEID